MNKQHSLREKGHASRMLASWQGSGRGISPQGSRILRYDWGEKYRQGDVTLGIGGHGVEWNAQPKKEIMNVESATF